VAGRRAVLALAGAALVVGALGFALGRPSGGPDPAAAVVSPRPSGLASLPAASQPPGSAVSSPSASAPLASSAPSPSATPANTAEALGPQLQATLDRLRIKTAIPGASATILFPDGSTWTGVSGLADVQAGRAVAPNTAFAIGSISKTFLATLIVELAAEGRIGLGDAAWSYLPGVKLDHAITVRQLLDHTSGLYDFFFHPRIDAALQANRAATWTAAQTLAYVGKPYFKPGLGWHYSNTNYLLLGLIAERVGRASLADQFRARFFGPLGLATAFYQVDERARGPLAHGYRFMGSNRTLPALDLADGTGVAPFRSVVTAAGGAGSIAASSIDIARWAKALYGGAVLSPDSLATMLADVSNTARYKPRIPYGLGVQSVTVGGWPALGHSGRLLGFQGVMRYFPGQGFSVAVLTNQSRADPGVILKALVAIVAPPPPPPPLPSPSFSSPPPSALPSQKP
jgi:D-alanyl-D-alanine carboxypeptidase